MKSSHPSPWGRCTAWLFIFSHLHQCSDNRKGCLHFSILYIILLSRALLLYKETHTQIPHHQYICSKMLELTMQWGPSESFLQLSNSRRQIFVVRWLLVASDVTPHLKSTTYWLCQNTNMYMFSNLRSTTCNVQILCSKYIFFNGFEKVKGLITQLHIILFYLYSDR